MARPDIDVFEDVLNLEEQYYTEGYNLGVADGSKSGRIEGRIFGLEKGFEKFLEMGRLNGRAAVWEARLPSTQRYSEVEKEDNRPVANEAPEHIKLPKLSGNERLKKHIDRLAALSDPNDLSTKNDEDDVSEFDDRLKDARAKATLISKIVGEDESNSSGAAIAAEGSGSGGSRGKALKVKRSGNDGSSTQRRTGEMEDFVGLPGRS